MIPKQKLFFLICLTIFLQIESKPNIVLILTDDQDVTLGSLTPMKKTMNLLSKEGATYENAFTTTPLCCPSRASILSGRYQHNHYVYNNSIAGNCSSKDWQDNFEKKSFAVHLKNAGYKTFYGGKYLNQYGRKDAGGPEHIPKGWDSWFGLVGNSVYYNFTISVNGKNMHYENEYLTNLINNKAIDFISNTNSKPFLIVVAPPAPHAPFTPEPKYNGSFNGQKIPREPHFNYADNDDKHWFVRMKPAPLPTTLVENLDKKFSQRWETLLSVDDLVYNIVEKLKAIKQLDNTYIFYTSDNGFHLGQLSMPWDKRQLYDFDIRVPFLVRGPGIKKNITVKDPILLMDIGPTFLDIAGIDGNHGMDGRSFLPVANSKNPRAFLIEHQGEHSFKPSTECPQLGIGVYNCKEEALCKCQDSQNNTYSCIRYISDSDNTIYCQFNDNEKFEEAYDLNADKYQLKNRVGDFSEDEKMIIKNQITYLQSCRSSQCHLTSLPPEVVLQQY